MFLEGLIRNQIKHWPSMFVKMIVENLEVEPTTLREDHQEGAIRMLDFPFITGDYKVIQVAFVNSRLMGCGWGAVIRESIGEVTDIVYGRLLSESDILLSISHCTLTKMGLR